MVAQNWPWWPMPRPRWLRLREMASADSALVYSPRMRTFEANSRRLLRAASLTRVSVEAEKSVDDEAVVPAPGLDGGARVKVLLTGVKVLLTGE